ncbi:MULTISPECIES: anti-sigma factor [Salinicola]|uniref:Anti-sigma K factor RskA C-terminal domain-containing protein n=1 Tax=Salinicola socius TaxID=404433 RepID=A0A1Q8SSB6_9GAMM|nr:MULTISPECIES: anti-sigma factor [Salinicola]OLO04323.1 hypothetical protein BTW07_09180 [Salinicola socius]
MTDHLEPLSPLGPDETDDLAGEYVLGTLSAERRDAVEHRLAHDAALRTAVWSWESRLQPYTALAEPVEPTPHLWQRIERSLDHQDGPVSTLPADRSPSRNTLWERLWDSVTVWRGVSFASVLAVAGLAAMLALAPSSAPSSRYLVVLMTPQHTQAGWVVEASSSQQLSLIPVGTFEVPPGKALEFWTKADDWSGPVSLGLVQPGESQQLSLKNLPPLEDNQLFELTLEDATGSPLDRPTGPIQFIGRAVEL